MDREGNILIHKNIKGNDFAFFLKLIEPYRHDLTVVCECCYNWYWLADACMDADIEFVLAHALYLKRNHPLLTPYAELLVSKHGKFKGNTILANKLGRAVYFMLQKGTAFDAELVV
jgi:hypothetical protein